jgi:nitrate reductase (NAD(P)H)
MMPTYHIGSLDEASRRILAEGEVKADADEKRATFLQPRSWTPALLHCKRIVSWDTRIFTFQLEHEDQTLGLPIGQHLMIRLRDPKTGEALVRSYTPISSTTQKGFMDVLVKVYFATNTTKGGKMSTAMDALQVGAKIDFKGPIGKFEYLGRGVTAVNGKQRKVSRFIMICGGSGITPIFQVFRAVMLDKEDTTYCTVFDGNRLVEDILCKEELNALVKGNEHRCKVIHTLTKATDEWTSLRGRINGDLVKAHCGGMDQGTLVIVCGPEALEKSIHKSLLGQGWEDDQILFF